MILENESPPALEGRREAEDHTSQSEGAGDSAQSGGSQQSETTGRDIRGAAQRLIDSGMKLVRLKPNSKEPLSEKGWQNSDPKSAQFHPDENVGVQLGAKSCHLVDLDLDIPEARVLSGLPCFFGSLPGFRRKTMAPDAPGHRLAVCKDAPDEVVQFKFTRKAELEAIAPLALPKAVVLELRAGKGYTVFPPSVIEGDALEYNLGNDTVPDVAWSELRKKAGLLAYASFAAACYPQKGDRDNFCFHFAGSLVHLGVDPDVAEEIVVAIARLKGDDWQQRKGKARTAAAKRDAGEPVTGLPEFLRHIGMEVCEKRLRDWLQHSDGLDAAPIPDDAIVVGRPEIHVFLDELQEAALAKIPDTLFRRAGSLVRLRTLEKKIEEDGIIRHPGVVEIASADLSWLRVTLSRAGVAFFRRSKGKAIQVEPPKDIALLLATAEDSRFDRLRGISMTPTLARNEPGYDAKSGLFLAFPEGMFPPAPMHPTREDAEAALDRLMQPLRAFPFKGAGSKSVVLSMFLSGVCREELRTCPLHGISAPTPGTGKTKLIDMAGILVTGTKPSHATHTASTEEMEKRLVSILRCGDQVINLDNAIAALEGEFLCAMLTSDVVQARILGESERVHLDTRTLLLATGNNLRLRGDMVRRAIVCRIDAQCEQPDQRKFDFDPVLEVADRRPQLVADALTVIRAYLAAGRPLPLDHRPLGSFEDWKLVRGALLWLGQDDPLRTQAAAREYDDAREMLNDILAALHRAFGSRPFQTAEINTFAAYEPVKEELRFYLKNNEWNPRAAAMLLATLRDRPCNGLMLEAGEDRKGTRVWCVKGEPLVAIEQKTDEPPF